MPNAECRMSLRRTLRLVGLRNQQDMKRKHKIGISVTAGLLVPIVACVLVLRYFDWNLAKPTINTFVGDTLQRPFAIHGDLALNWSRDYGGDGWKSWVPWPHLSARQIAIGNPKTMGDQDSFLTVDSVSFALDPLRLLESQVYIPLLSVEQPNLHLLRTADGTNNWAFAPHGATPDSDWKVSLVRIAITDGKLAIDDDEQHSHLNGKINTVTDVANKYGVKWTIEGSHKGDHLRADGEAGTLLDLRNAAAPYPVLANIHYGKTHIEARGSLIKPAELASLDLQLNVSGDSMADLYPLIGVVMPRTPSYKTTGHLIGSIGSHGTEFHYEKFQGRVGSSDLEGSLDYQSALKSGRPRPFLGGSVQSNLLRFSDLGPVVGTDGKNEAQSHAQGAGANKEAGAVKNGGHVLPEQTFSFERWRHIDADVQFTGRKIIRDERLPIDNLVAHIHLRDGVLSLLPLEFGVAGGKIVSNIKMDGNGNAIKADLTASLQHIKLNQIAPGFKPMESSLGEINGNMRLSSTGNSVAKLLGASNGEMKILTGQGTISKLVLDEVGLNVLNVLLTKMFGDKQINMNCIAGDFVVKDGLMDTRNFLMETDETDINMTGQVDLAKEMLDLTIKPQNKKFRLVSLRAPIYVTGSFREPTVNIDKKSVAMRAGGALALGVLSPLAVMFPLVDVAPNSGSQCAQLILDYRSKPGFASSNAKQGTSSR
jgi:uncharacterized protein involved in outer membrane biogenesis